MTHLRQAVQPDHQAHQEPPSFLRGYHRTICQNKAFRTKQNLVRLAARYRRRSAILDAAGKRNLDQPDQIQKSHHQQAQHLRNSGQKHPPDQASQRCVEHRYAESCLLMA